MLAKIILIILGVTFVGFVVTLSVLFGYDLWKESELRTDILKKKKEKRKLRSNQQWLSTLSPGEWVKTVDWLFNAYGNGFTSTNAAVAEWLEKEHEEI